MDIYTERYVIKNKHDKYWAWDLNKMVSNTWSWDLFDAKFFGSKRDAEIQAKRIRDCRTDCEIVKIRFVEVKDE